MNPVYTKSNTTYGITANVYVSSHGYSVSLKDDDAGETAPFVKTFPKLEDAKNYADKLTA